MSDWSDPHPIRLWRLQRDLGKKLQVLRDSAVESRKKYGPPVDGVQYIERPLGINPQLAGNFQDLQKLLFKYEEASLFLDSFLKFWDDYRQIYSFDPAIAEALAETDVDDIPWSEVRLPHPEFYLSLGDYGQQAFCLGDFQYIIDGAYVRHVPRASKTFPNDSILFFFTSKLISPSYEEAIKARKRNDFHFAEPTYEYCVSGAGCQTLGEAIRRGGDEYAAMCDRRDVVRYESARDWAPRFGVAPFGPRIKATRRKFDCNREMILEAVPAFFNAIFYLSAGPEKQTETFPQSAPRDLIQSHRHTTNETIKSSIERTLAKKGFIKITFISDGELHSSLPAKATGRRVRAHWRRGHWRNQPYGKELALRRWRWVRPVLVKKEEPLKTGAIHEIRNTSRADDAPGMLA